MATVRLEYSGGILEGKWEDGVDLTLPVRDAGPKAFGLPSPAVAPVEFGEVSLSIDKGATVNCSTIHVTPHGNGTHTECAGHVMEGSRGLEEVKRRNLLCSALVVTVDGTAARGPDDKYPTGSEEEAAVNGARLRAGIAKALGDAADKGVKFDAIVVRTLPNDEDAKRTYDWSGKGAPYFTGEAMQVVLEYGVRHFVCDLPSVDREDDGGHLIAHKTFFFGPSRTPPPPSSPLPQSTITELALIPNSVPDGVHILHLNIAPILLADAAPSSLTILPNTSTETPREDSEGEGGSGSGE